MKREFGLISIFILIVASCWLAAPARAQVGNSGSIDGIVKDPAGAAVQNATVTISNPVSGLERSTTSGADG
ncbi:MAG TPA: carboxypeptidase-like regulatory domain-containing protein, partial [Candidatus Solibacter sp.]|nr:carboxypeptidase-like regulatory domain-containing protein [Candidatus Solibacter sp.]